MKISRTFLLRQSIVAIGLLLCFALTFLSGCRGSGEPSTPAEEPAEQQTESEQKPEPKTEPKTEPAPPPSPLPADPFAQPDEPAPTKPVPTKPTAPVDPFVQTGKPLSTKSTVSAEPSAQPSKPFSAQPVERKEPAPVVQAVPVEEPRQVEPAVKTQSPVRTDSPVRTESPVQTDSPVKSDSAKRIPRNRTLFGRISLLLPLALLQAEEFSEPAQDTALPEKLRFNFRYAPWKDVIEWFSDQAGLSLQADNVPQGSLNLTDNRYYSPTEALDVLNSYLLFKEYTILRKGKTLFVIYLPDGIPPNLLEPISPEELDTRGKYELCRCVFTLYRTTPDVIQLEAEKLLGPQGSVVPLPKSQQIIITETGGTLRAIRDIIRRIDDPDQVSSGTIHLVETKNLSADEALGIMRKLLAIEETDPSLRTAVDISGTKIWMSGRGDMIERAKEIIRTIDDSFSSEQTVLEGQPQFEVYDTGSADPATVLAILQTLLAGVPDVRLSIDAKTGGLAALGRPANHATIRETIRQLQLNVPEVEVIPLKRLSPLSAVESIKKFFATTGSAQTTGTTTTTAVSGAAPATVEADISARQIIVRGTRTQIAEIRALLDKLGEDGLGGPAVDDRTIRSIPLSPAAAGLVIDQLKEIWPKLQGNEMRIVAPSAIVPMRSTTELGPKKQDTPQNSFEKPEQNPWKKPQQKPADDSPLDRLIDETFEQQIPGPVTKYRSHSVQYLTVKMQHENSTGNATPPSVEELLPVYRPIQAPEDSETEILKRQINKLQQQIDRLQQNTPSTHVSVPTADRTPSEKTVPTGGAPVVVSMGPNGLMIASEDPEALNKLEELIRLLSDESLLGKTSMVVYYLKYSTAEVVAQTLQTLLGSSSSTSLGVSGAGSMDTNPALDGQQQAAFYAALNWGNTIEKTGPVSISSDSRLNALFVQANPVDHKTIEKLLPVLDQATPPGGDILSRSKPRLIPLENIRAEEAKAAVESIYANRIQGGQSGTGTAGPNRQQGTYRQPGQQRGGMMPGGMPMGGPMMGGPPMMGPPQMMIQQLMSRMGGGGQNTANAKEQEPTMTLGVDARSNSLIVSSPEALFHEVEAFVKELDQIALMTQTDTQVITLKNISPELARQTLGNVLGDSVKFTTSQASNQSGTGQMNQRSGFGGWGGGSQRGGFGTARPGGTMGGTGNPFLNMFRGGGGGFGGGGFGGAARPAGGGFGGGFGGAAPRPGGFGGR